MSDALTGWTARIVFELDPAGTDSYGVREITFRPDDGRLSLPTQRAWKALRLAHATEALRAALTGDGVWGAVGESSPRWLSALHGGRRSGRAGTDPILYAEWARRRVEAEEHAPTRPIKWLSKQYGNSEASINAHLHRARHHPDGPLLEGNPPTMTARAIELLGGTSGER